MREAQLWIMTNLSVKLFAEIPDLVDAPDAQLPSQPGEEGAIAEGAGPEPQAQCSLGSLACASYPDPTDMIGGIPDFH